MEEDLIEMKHLNWQDYVAVVVMLLMSIIIGIYFGIYRPAVNTQDYLIGGKKMQLVPVAFSLVASFLSGISLLGIPTETYLYGMHYFYIMIGVVLMAISTNFFFLPVFYDLNLISSYEYLEKRFDKKVKMFGAFLFVITLITWLPIVIYVPALALNQVTGANVHYITPVICVICIFYTSLGGLKSAVWTDFIQVILMLIAVVLVAIKGTIDNGGIGVVLERNLESHRIELPHLDLNPSSRYTLWSLAIGGWAYFTHNGFICQFMLQRYLSLPSLENAKKAVWYFVLGLFIIMATCTYCGILIYSTFYKCDPLTTKYAKEKDQLLPLLVMEVLGDYPGLSGIFIAGTISAALSTLSSGFNGISAVVFKDLYPFFFTKSLTEKQSTIMMKLSVVIFGTLCVCLVYIIEHLGAVLPISMTIASMGSGPLLGIFKMGIFLPWVNASGALIGGILSVVFMAWLCIQAQIDMINGDLIFPQKPLTTERCDKFIYNNSVIDNVYLNTTNFEKDFKIHHISYLWYTFLGAFLTVIIGILVSFITKPMDPKNVDARLLAPCLRKLFKTEILCEVVHSVTYTSEPSEKNENSKYRANIAMKKVEEFE